MFCQLCTGQISQCTASSVCTTQGGENYYGALMSVQSPCCLVCNPPPPEADLLAIGVGLKPGVIRP
jgi:hypothetical protein